MSCAPSVPKLWAGGRPRLREEIPPDENLKKGNQVRESYSARPERGYQEDGPRPGALSPELPGAEQSGERRTDEASATFALCKLDAWGRTRVDSARSLESQTSPLEPSRTPSKSAPPPQGGASIPRASAPASTGCLLPDWDAQGCELLSARGVSLGPTQGSGAPACKGCANADLPCGWCKRPTHCGLLGPGGSVSMIETWPASPGSWCATWDGGCFTDHGLGGHSWPLPQPVRDASVVSVTRWQGAPSTGPWDKNQVFPQMSKAFRLHLDHVKWVAPRGKPLGPEPPL